MYSIVAFAGLNHQSRRSTSLLFTSRIACMAAIIFSHANASVGRVDCLVFVNWSFLFNVEFVCMKFVFEIIDASLINQLWTIIKKQVVQS